MTVYAKFYSLETTSSIWNDTSPGNESESARKKMHGYEMPLGTFLLSLLHIRLTC